MQTITYHVKNGIYVNLTNRCPCACTFCLRQNGDSVYGSDSLWLDHEPDLKEICDSLDNWKMDDYSEIVFCGYGEPTERLDVLLETAKYIKSRYNIPIRINTNGLADLIWGRSTAPQLKGLIDVVSISLNATNKEDYLKTVRPKYGIDSYDAMLQFARDCTRYVPEVVMTIVDVVTTSEEQEQCKEIARSVGAKLRIRPYETR
ncbi:MAG: TIGR04100 family radical SAM protein [Lachnospiraceae bacterium]|nr:TIGR04100 family radical SAM protein [Lachnospiraceae bacterium]